MISIFRRKKIPHPDGLDSTSYRAGVVFDGGAEHLAYINLRPHPLLTPYAGFIPQQQLSPVNAQVVYQYNSLPLQPILPGIQAGQYDTSILLQQNQLSSSPNNDLLNDTLFGGATQS